MSTSLVRALSRRLNDRFTHQLVADDDALLVLFRMLADAEENGEAQVFDAVADRLGPKLAALVRRHADDERRHIGLTRRALRLLHDRPELRDGRANLVEVVDTHMGGMLRGEGTDAELGRAYLLLYALERRMVAQLTQLERGLQGRRPELAAIVAEIRDDELKHIRWCQVVAWELMGADEASFRATRDEMVAVEARVYLGVTRQNLTALLDVGLRGMSLVERGFWRLAAWTMGRLPSLPVPDPDGVIAARTWEPPVAPRPTHGSAWSMYVEQVS